MLDGRREEKVGGKKGIESVVGAIQINLKGARERLLCV